MGIFDPGVESLGVTMGEDGLEDGWNRQATVVGKILGSRVFAFLCNICKSVTKETTVMK